MKEVCFFVKTKERAVIFRNEFYKQDIEILEELGYKVKIATSIWQINLRADFFFVWWWTWAFIPVFIARCLNRPVVVTGVFDHYIDGKPIDFYKRPVWHQRLIRYALKKATANIFVSSLEYNFIRQQFSSSQDFVNPHSVNLSEYCPAEGHFRAGDFLLCISWLSKENVHRKCILQTIEAFAVIHQTHPELKLLLVGKEGDGLPSVRNLISKLHLEQHVVITGPVSKEEKIRLMQNCAIYLQPTLVEGFGLAILEAMACGAPIITSSTGAVPEVTQNNVCFVTPTDINEIADAVLYLLENPSQTANLTSRAVERARYFSKDAKLLRTRMIFERIGLQQSAVVA